MQSNSELRALTLRIPPTIYEASRRIANKRAVSLNLLIQQSLEAMIRAEEDRASYDAYTLLGQDAEECDVEYAIHAQAEVMLRDE